MGRSGSDVERRRSTRSTARPSRRVDASDLLTDILAMPEHLRDALWKVESAGLERWDRPGGLVVAGMGGSAIGGALARAILGDHASRPIFAPRGLRAAGLDARPTPPCSARSYSGNTEETLACYEAAGVIGARRVVVTSGGELAEQARADGVPVIPVAGGLQPRAAVGYMTVAALEVAALCGAGPRMRPSSTSRPSTSRSSSRPGAPTARRRPRPRSSPARCTARCRSSFGAGLTDADRLPVEDPDQRERQAAGVRGRAAGARPQRDRRLVGAADLGRFAAVFLDDADTHPRVQGAHRADRQIVDGGRPAASPRRVARLDRRGARALARAARRPRLALPGVLRGVDPTPVPAIERLDGPG